MRSFKLTVIKYYIFNQCLYWKDPGGILVNCIEEDEANRIMNELHKGACGGNHNLLESHILQNY